MNKRYLIITIVLVGFVVYFRTLFNGFVWDDEEFLLNNPLVHSLGNIAIFFSGGSLNAGGSQVQSGLYYRPIMQTIYATIYTLFGAKAFFFHFLQVATHIVNSILVFLLFENILHPQGGRELGDNAHPAGVISFFLALIFLVHPVNVEAVSFISATQEVLYVLTGILALFLVSQINPESQKTSPFPSLERRGLRGGYRVFSVSLLLVASFLLKETGLVFAPLILIYIWLFRKEKFLRYFLVTALSVGLYFTLHLIFAPLKFESQGLFPIMRASILDRFLTIPSIIFFYLKVFFVPKNLAIAQHWVVKSLSAGEFFIPLVLVLGILGCMGGLVIKKKNKVGIFFFLWLLIGLLPHLQFIPLNMTAAERWFYLPMVGMLGTIGTFVPKLKVKSEKLKIIFIVIVIALSIRTIIRTFDWRDGLTLYSHDIKIGKHTFDLENNLGVELFRIGEYDKAGKHFEKSVALAPYWWVNWNNLGAVVERKGEFEKAEQYYEKSIRNGDYYLAYENYVLILIKQKEFNKAKKFLEKEALKKFSNNTILNQAYEVLILK